MYYHRCTNGVQNVRIHEPGNSTIHGNQPQYSKFCCFRGHRKTSQKSSETNKIRFGGWGFTKLTLEASNGLLYTNWSDSWSLKCELLFVSREGRGFQAKLILFVSLGFCELLRWPLTMLLLWRCGPLVVYLRFVSNFFQTLLSCVVNQSKWGTQECPYNLQVFSWFFFFFFDRTRVHYVIVLTHQC